MVKQSDKIAGDRPTKTTEEQKEYLDKINEMTHVQMASLVRFAPSGNIYFDSRYPEIADAFADRFKTFGGMTPVISKLIGWDR